MFSAVKTDGQILLSAGMDNIYRMANYLVNTSVDKGTLTKIVVPKNIDIICFVNDLAIKRKIGPKYVIQDGIDAYHPDDYIWHQCRIVGNNNDLCNVFIKDTYDDAIMEGESCPGTAALVAFYKNAYNQVSSEILNKNSLFVRGNAGIYSIIERNLAEFITYLSWTKTNEVLKYLRSFNTDNNFDLASSFEVIERTDGVVYDLVRKLKESKDSSFYMVDGKTGNKIKMLVDGSVPDAASDLTNEFYQQEFVNNLRAYRDGTVTTVTSAIKSAEDKIQKSMSVGIKTGINMAASLTKQGWKIEVVNGVDCFVYHDKVYANSVVGGDRMKRFTFPEECQNLLYLYDITVPIDTNLRSGISVSDPSKGVRAKGFFPHRGSTSGDAYEDLKHINELGKVCIGDLDGKPFEKIVNLIDALSCVYQPSMMGNLASKCISLLYGGDLSLMSSSASEASIKKSKEYIKPFIDNRGIIPKMEKEALKKPSSTSETPSSPPSRSSSGARMGSIFTVGSD